MRMPPVSAPHATPPRVGSPRAGGYASPCRLNAAPTSTMFSPAAARRRCARRAMLLETVRAIVAGANEMKSEPPRPLMRDPPPADPFPVEALGAALAPAARAIHDR